MHSIIILLARLALILGPLAVFTPPAFAAAPSNDTFANVKLVALGFSETLDTTEATTDADNAQLLEICEPPAIDASLWYVYDGDGSRVAIDVRDSS